MKYMRKPTVVEATQWHRSGDHRAVGPSDHKWGDCMVCGRRLSDHGSLLVRGAVRSYVCPGDYIIDKGSGQYDTVHRKEFESKYEPFEDHTQTYRTKGPHHGA